MTPGSNSIDELVIPCWRNGKAFARVQAESAVENKVKECLLARASTVSDIAEEKASAQLQTHYPLLKDGIRISDLRDSKYWMTMLVTCAFFVLVELVAIIMAQTEATKLVTLQHAIGFGLVAPTWLFAILYAYSLYMYKSDERLSHLPSWFRPSWLHALPVLWLAVGLLVINLWLVLETGLRQSPFLPAFLAAALTVIGLPRENSRVILWLTAIATFLGLAVCLVETKMTKEELHIVLVAWGAGPTGNLPFLINAITFGVAAFLAVILRQFSFRIGQQ